MRVGPGLDPGTKLQRGTHKHGKFIANTFRQWALKSKSMFKCFWDPGPFNAFLFSPLHRKFVLVHDLHDLVSSGPKLDICSEVLLTHLFFPG